MLFIVTKEKYSNLKEQIKDLENKKTIAEQDRDFSRARESQGRDTIKKLNTKILNLEQQHEEDIEKIGELRQEILKLKRDLKTLKKIKTLFENKTAKLSEIKNLVIGDTKKTKTRK